MFESKEFIAYFLNIAAQAEADDQGVFVGIAKVVSEDLRAGLARHAADEERHAEMLRDCVTRNGGTPSPVPEELQLFRRLLEAAEITDPTTQLMDFFLLLQVAEERAVKQYTMIAEALRDHDPESAEALDSIVTDETAHIEHCRILATSFATDAGDMVPVLARLREVEAKVFSAFAAAVFDGWPPSIEDPPEQEAFVIPLALRDGLIRLLEEELPMKTAEWAVNALRQAPKISITITE